MTAGSTVRAFTLNVGLTSLNDTGIGGYLDTVVVDQSTANTTYDSNQGQCVSRSLELGRR